MLTRSAIDPRLGIIVATILILAFGGFRLIANWDEATVWRDPGPVRHAVHRRPLLVSARCCARLPDAPTCRNAHRGPREPATHYRAGGGAGRERPK